MKSLLKRWVPGVALVLSCSLLGSACFGSFTLTRKVYSFNKSMDSKFVQTIVMWAFSIVPVYSIAATVDVFVLNLIEFWTGSNPLAMAPGEERTQNLEVDGRIFRLTVADQGRTLKVAELIDGKVTNPLVLHTNDRADGLAVTTEDGAPVAEVQMDNEGIFVSDPSGAILAHADAQDVQRAEDQVIWGLVDETPRALSVAMAQ